jgi:hypothetical protein
MTAPPEVLREYRVELIPTEGLGAEKRKPGHRTKFGGMPDEFQPNSTALKCSLCEKKMQFIGQIDSFDKEFMFMDMGMIYIWYCFECFEPHATMESY